MIIRFSFGVVPVLFVGLVFGVIFGAPYIALLPENVIGQNNAAILLSVFGFCFLLADRLLYLKWKIYAWFVALKVWLWGVVLMIGGLVLWIQSFNTDYLLLFIVHWTVLIALSILLLVKIQTEPEPEEGYEEIEDSEDSMEQ